MEMNSFNKRLIEAGLPVDYNRCNIMKTYKKKIYSFINGNSNLVVMGELHYEYAIKILRLKLANDLTCTLKHFSASHLLGGSNNVPAKYLFSNFGNYRTIAITMINPVVDKYKLLLSCLVDFLISDNRKVLLSTSCGSDEFSDIFQYNWESIDNNFEVISLER